MMLLGGGAFGVCFSHEGGAFLSGISAPIKRNAKELSCYFHPVRTERGVGSGPGSRLSPECDHAGALIMGFPAFRMVRNRFLFISCVVCGIWL